MNASPFRRFACATALALAATTSASATTFSVGADSACSHIDLDAALRAAASTSDDPVVIRLARNRRHTLSSTLPDGVVLEGGYSQCSDPHPLGHTTLTVAPRAMTDGLPPSSRLDRIAVKPAAPASYLADGAH